MKNQLLLSFALLILLLGGACGPDDEFCDDPGNIDCPNYDPCTQVIAANSDFKIVTRTRRSTDTIIEIEMDTSFAGGNSYYVAEVTEGLESYAWKVGTDPTVFTGSQVNLDFTNYTGDVSVTLETTTINSGLCLEEHQLKDIKTKQIHYSFLRDNASIFGIFKGSLLGDNDGREYEVSVVNTTSSFRRLFGLPMPNDCNLDDRGIPVFYGYQFFVSAFVQQIGRTNCRDLIVIGRINLEDSNELRIDYVYDDDDGKRKEVVFVGRRQ